MQLLLALLEGLGHPAALLGLDGKLLAVSNEHPAWELLAEQVEWLRQQSKLAASELAEGEQPAERTLPPGSDGPKLRLQLLVAGGRRPSGWLARVGGGPSPEEAGAGVK